MVPLNIRSTYTLLQSPLQPTVLVETAQKRGYRAVGLADETVLYALDQFYQATQNNEIHAVLGLTIEVQGLINAATQFPLTLYVENQQGYHHLIQISSFLKTRKAGQTVSLTDLQPFFGGLFIVVPGISELSLLLMNGTTGANEFIAELVHFFSSDHIFIGVNLEMSSEEIETIRTIAEPAALRLIAFDEVRYLDPEDQFTRRVIQGIGQGEVLTNLGASMSQAGQQFLQQAELWENAYRAKNLSDAALNSDWLAAHSQFEMAKVSTNLPQVIADKKLSAKDYLADLSMQGLKRRLRDLQGEPTQYYQRLSDELAVIDQLGFNEYFLIVWDVIDFAHRQSIRTGPGRGSAAGSLVAYALYITDVDPIAFDLLFERFLNAERAQMPDIDIDIPDNKREIVLEYLHDKYGHQQVAQIITFSTFGMKQSMRDVARVFGLKPAEMDQLSKAIPNDVSTLDEAVKKSQRLQNVLIDLPVDGQLLLNTAKKVIGLPRNHSLHAAGIVLSATPLVQTIPVQLGEDGRLVTQLTKNPVERLGLLKMDFLALSNLNILDIALNEITKYEKGFSINQIDLNDSQTLELFKQGYTNGIFQFESSGMKNMLRRLKPDRFEDLVAANALFRPGPMQNIQTFIARKHGQEAIDLLDDSVADILSPTYGVIVYQEQVMRVAEKFAGFSLSEADLLRRAMSKKDADKIAAIKNQFISGAIAKGHTQDLAQKVYGYIETFAEYGFNRSHSVAYSKLAFQLAYLKAHYPTAFFKAVLNADINNQEKVRHYILEAKNAKVMINRPDINLSWAGYSSNTDGLQMGFASIQGMRRDFRENIIASRQAQGAFKDLADFIGRIDNKFRSVEAITPLVDVGAFDRFNPNRKALVVSLQGFIDAIGLAGESLSLFKSLTPKVREMDDYSQNERLQHEKQYLGVYLSGHPLEPILEAVNRDDLTTVSNLSVDQKSIKILLYIENVKLIRTKNGDAMAFVDAMDLTGQISVTVFPRTYTLIKPLLQAEQIVAVYGTVQQQKGRDGLQIIANQVVSAQQLLQNNQTRADNSDESPSKGQWYLRVPMSAENQTINTELEAVFQVHHGNNPVLVVYEADNRKLALPQSQWLQSDQATMRALQSIFGTNNVVFKTIK